MGSKDLQNKWYQEASKYLTTYYGQLAFLKINPEKTFELDLEQVVDKDYKKKFENKGLVKVIYLLNELNKDKYTKHMLRHLALDDIEKGSEILAAELATNISRYDFAIQIAKIASYEKRFLNNYNYPIIGTPKIINGRKINSLFKDLCSDENIETISININIENLRLLFHGLVICDPSSHELLQFILFLLLENLLQAEYLEKLFEPL